MMGTRVWLTSTSEALRQAAEIGLDLEYTSDLNLVNIYQKELKTGQFADMPILIRRTFTRLGVLTVRKTAAPDQKLTSYGLQLLQDASRR